jgi:hypothetical protein
MQIDLFQHPVFNNGVDGMRMFANNTDCDILILEKKPLQAMQLCSHYLRLFQKLQLQAFRNCELELD